MELNDKVKIEQDLGELTCLRSRLGDELIAMLLDNSINEIMLNADGELFVETSDGQMLNKGSIEKTAARKIVLTIASKFVPEGFNADHPIFDCQIPLCNARFHGMLPPLVDVPSFCIRRHLSKLLDFDELLHKGMLDEYSTAILTKALINKRSMIICGETGSGKTTLLCSLLAKLKTLTPDERIISIEDTPEIPKILTNTLATFAHDKKDPQILVVSALRMRPDRIIMGEIRGAEALDLMDALTTGHSGSMATMHAGNPLQALLRLSLLVSRHPQAPRRIEETVANAIDLIVQLEAKPKRCVSSIVEVNAFKNGNFITTTLYQKTTTNSWQSDLENKNANSSSFNNELQEVSLQKTFGSLSNT